MANPIESKNSTELPPNTLSLESREEVRSIDGKNYLLSYVSASGKELKVPLVVALSRKAPNQESYQVLIRQKNHLKASAEKIISALDKEDQRSLKDRVFNIGGVRSEGVHNNARILFGSENLLTNPEFLQMMGFPDSMNENNMFIEAQNLSKQLPGLGDRPMIGIFMDWVRDVHTAKKTSK